MRRKQSGIFLISAAVAVGVAGMLITFWGVNYTRQLRVERAERIGESLKIMGEATQSFAVMYHDRLNKLFEKNESFAIGDVQFTREGTSPRVVGNLTAESLIKVMNVRGAATRPPNGMGEYAIRVYEDCVDNKCDIKTLVYLTEPMKRAYSNAPDYDAAATAIRKIGALGGMSRQDSPDQFRFLDNDGSERAVVNPSAQPGLIAVRGGHQTSAMDTLLSLDGRKSMTGNLNLEDTNGGANGATTRHNIVGAGNIQGKGTLQMGSLDVGEASIKGTLNLESKKDNKIVNNNIVNAGDIEGTGRLKMAGIQAKSATVGALTATEGATISGNLDLQNNDIDGANAVKATSVRAKNVESRSLKSTSGVVELGEAVIEGSECDVWGLGRDGAGRILSCQQEKGEKWKWKLSMQSAPVTKDEVPKTVVEQIVNDNRGDSLYISSFTIPSPRQGKDAVGFPLLLGSKGGVCKAEGGSFVMLYDYWETGRRNSWGYDQVGFQVSRGQGTGRMMCLTKGRIAYLQMGGYEIARGSTERSRIGGRFFIGRWAGGKDGDGSSGYSGDLGSYFYLPQGHADFDAELRKFLMMRNSGVQVFAGAVDTVQSNNGEWRSLF
ncbi:hypothetical protein PI93_023795 [Pandoraea fibrosis]|uniref:Uncharacterized protein n=1 Tax=Pandoraea fibrosis TaxID=1891094 RepID=A0ABX6HXY4_9BURK|nr:hypothetical protein [Pandoraea fibrosis]QHE94491.1 hypothetical protein PJ20_023790 [Pandoraea fibrosis]QHF15329.1 hypothetical protein PI93_023795 [Pandoraea fibrosis]